MTNRRSFIRRLGTVAAAFTVLPSAATYARTWVRPSGAGMWVVNPEWVNAPYEVLLATYEHGYKIYNDVTPILFKRNPEMPVTFIPKAARFDLVTDPVRGPVLRWVPPVVKSSPAFP